MTGCIQDIQETELIVLRKVPYGEADLIVTALSAELGKLALFVRGGNGGHRRNFPEIELFRRLLVAFKPGRGDLFIPCSVEIMEDFWGISRSIERYQAASWIASLALLNTMPMLPNPFFTNAVEVGLRRLAKDTTVPAEAVLTGVGLALMFESGWLAHAVQSPQAASQCRQILEMASGKEPPDISDESWHQQFDWCKQLLLINECRLPE